jgi:hypothetical protein
LFSLETRSSVQYLVEPMTLEHMRQNRVRSLDMRCNQCRHRVILNIDHLPGDLMLAEFNIRYPSR